MSIVVMKFGGTSVADAEQHQARRAPDRRRARAGPPRRRRALGARQDDRRAGRAGRARSPPTRPAREMDMLLSTGERDLLRALRDGDHTTSGHEAISLTGSQAGIVTDYLAHQGADPRRARRPRSARRSRQDQIVLVAGFQGVSTDSRDVTTLGRGGSDTTAVALAAALGAEVCEIYTDVAGRLQRRPADRPATRASCRARLLRGDARDGGLRRRGPAAALGRVRPQPRRARSTAARASSDGPGTLVVAEDETMEQHRSSPPSPTRTDEARVTLTGVPRRARRRRPQSSARWPRRTSTST